MLIGKDDATDDSVALRTRQEQAIARVVDVQTSIDTLERQRSYTIHWAVACGVTLREVADQLGTSIDAVVRMTSDCPPCPSPSWVI